ncbi:uncharacterized protein LOC129795419 [Lutzomyia longipalpis]|uniref:uncharacterized protein LOC129795419 n=1 Tax=Lutzomyia longipalpis TaxID=7200 RepID=UPI002483456F|nr:uncharacterized protein LOC129795419 [Lutzomyia longipalpis]
MHGVKVAWVHEKPIFCDFPQFSGNVFGNVASESDEKRSVLDFSRTSYTSGTKISPQLNTEARCRNWKRSVISFIFTTTGSPIQYYLLGRYKIEQCRKEASEGSEAITLHWIFTSLSVLNSRNPPPINDTSKLEL